MGVISSCGFDVETFWDALLRGRSGISGIERFDVSGLRTTIGGEIKSFEPEMYVNAHDARHMDRFTQYALAAARTAVRDAALKMYGEDPFRVGVVLGSGIGGLETLLEQDEVLRERGPRRVSPYVVPMMIINMAAGHLSMVFGARGPCTTVCTACASATDAIGAALRLIQSGEAEVVITGGTEAPLSRLALAGFGAAHALSTRNEEPARASRPFDAGRDGFVIAEGAAVLVLESEEHARARGALAYGAVSGYANRADASHITAPAADGLPRIEAMRLAVADAGLLLDEIGYINAHGTSTPANDKDESQVIRRLFGANPPPTSSTKSVTGHLLGAAGAVEAIACLLAINRGLLPPTINYDQPDPECDLDFVPNVLRPATVRHAISNSFGFGGQNAVLAFSGVPGEDRREAPALRWTGLEEEGKPVAQGT